MKLNGKTYNLPELNFNTMCVLEDMGISLSDINHRTFNTIRGFVALAVGDAETAGKEIDAHIKNGGKLNEITKEIKTAIAESDFFQALGASQTEGNVPSQTEEN